MKNRIKQATTLRAVVPVVAAFALSGCGVFDLDVGNPNNLIEESVRREAAASAMVNGSLSLVSTAVSSIWQPYLVASDEMYWIGSRDAWNELDNGFVGNPNNEFTDGAFPSVGRGVWMARQAVRILTVHVSNNPGVTSFQFDLARGQLYYGIMLMVIGEVMEDMAFSDKTDDGQPYSQQNKTMADVLSEATTQLDAAITTFSAQGETTWLMQATAVRARVTQSRAISLAINPVGATPSLVNAAGTDALTVITMAGGVAADWNYDLRYSAASQSNNMAGWVNDRKENQFDLSLVTVDAANDISGIALMDPIDNIPDPVVKLRLEHWKQGAFDDKGGVYPPMTVASTRLMHLILAENGLQSMTAGAFELHINHIRDMDGLTPFVSGGGGMPSDQAMLEHTRRVNTMIMGLRLADMYRWGVTDPKWQGPSDAIQTPGEMLPITIIEIRANCYLNSLGCG